MRRAVPVAISVALLFAIIAPTSARASTFWVGAGPQGGSISAFAFDGNTDVFAGLYIFGGLYRSTDGGQTWSQRSLLGSTIQSITIDPDNASTIYVGSTTGYVSPVDSLKRSTDGGLTWTTLNAGASPYFAIAPSNHSVMYADSPSGPLMESTDGGANWITRASQGAYSIAVDPLDPTHVLLATNDFNNRGIFNSTDSGQNFTRTDISFSSVIRWVGTQIVDGATSGPRASTDGGQTFHVLGTGFTGSASAIAATDANHLWVGGSGGIYISTDGGATWNPSGTAVSFPNALGIAPDASSVLAGTSSSGIYRSSDGGGTFTPANQGVYGASGYHLAIDPQDPSTRYFGAIFGGVFRSNDGGGTWNAATFPSSPNQVTSLVVNPAAPSVVYAGTAAQGFFISSDGGANFTAPANSGLPNFPTITSIAPLSQNDIAVIEQSNGLYFTANAGALWSLTNPGVGPPFATLEGDGKLYAFSDNGIARASDTGGALGLWTTLPRPLGGSIAVVSNLIRHPGIGFTHQVYVALDDGTLWSGFISHDSPEWHQVSTAGLPPSDPIVRIDVTSSPQRPSYNDHRTIVTQSGAVYVQDQSGPWQLLSGGPAVRAPIQVTNAPIVTDITGASGTPATTYVATLGAGMLAIDLPPFAVMNAFAAVQKAKSFAAAWGGDGGASEVFNVRARRAPFNGGFGSESTFKSLTSLTHAAYPGAAGNTYCFEAEALDVANRTGGWSGEKCTAVPLDDRALTTHGSWARGKASGDYLGTFTESKVKGATLTLAHVRSKHIALIAERCKGCGSVQVLLGSTSLGVVNLAASSTHKEYIKLFTATSAGKTLTLKVATSGKPVIIDGVGVSAV